jgi:hypothetical protein
VEFSEPGLNRTKLKTLEHGTMVSVSVQGNRNNDLDLIYFL